MTAVRGSFSPVDTETLVIPIDVHSLSDTKMAAGLTHAARQDASSSLHICILCTLYFINKTLH